MQDQSQDRGPDTVLEDGVPDSRAAAPLQRQFRRMLVLALVALLGVVLGTGWLAYQRQRTQTLLSLHAQATLTQQALDMRLDLVRKHVAGMRYAMERNLRWPVLADSGFLDRLQQRNLSPLRDAPWERLPVDLVRETGALHLDPAVALDPGALRRDLNAVSAALPAVVALHGSTPALLSSYYLDVGQHWRWVYPAQGREERLRASGTDDMGQALKNLWPGTGFDPVRASLAALQEQRSATWTPPFFTGKALAIGLVAPVTQGNEPVGTVGADVALEWIDAVLVQHAPPLGRALVVNAQGAVLGDSAGALTRASAPVRLADLVPGADAALASTAPDPEWQRLPLRGTDWQLLVYQPTSELRSAALGTLKPYFMLGALVLAVLGAWVYWQHRNGTQPALQLVHYVQQLEYAPQCKAPPVPALWAPWFAQLSHAARDRETRLTATLRHARETQSVQDRQQAQAESQNAALLAAQEQLQQCQQQLVKAERLAALAPTATKATQALLPLLQQAQQLSQELHGHNEHLQQGLLHTVPADELQQHAAAVDKTALKLHQQLEGMVPVLQGLRQALTDPTRETPREFRLHDLVAQVLTQLPANVRRTGIHFANAIPRDLSLNTRASGCGQLIGQLLSLTVGQAFAGRDEGIVRLVAKTDRLDSGLDVVVLQITDNGAAHPAVLAEHTQRALLQGALEGALQHVAGEGANTCTITLAQHLSAPATAPTATATRASTE